MVVCKTSNQTKTKTFSLSTLSKLEGSLLLIISVFLPKEKQDVKLNQFNLLPKSILNYKNKNKFQTNLLDCVYQISSIRKVDIKMLTSFDAVS